MVCNHEQTGTVAPSENGRLPPVLAHQLASAYKKCRSRTQSSSVSPHECKVSEMGQRYSRRTVRDSSILARPVDDPLKCLPSRPPTTLELFSENRGDGRLGSDGASVPPDPLCDEASRSPKTEGRPLRVVHVASQMVTGGMEKLLVEFARHADRSRFDLRFVALGTRGSPADDIERCGWPVTTLQEAPGLRPLLVFRLAGLLKGWGADVVHAHNSKPLIYAGTAGRLLGVRRVIFTRHGQRFGASRHETLLFRLATRTADRVVCVSHDAARISYEEGIAPNKVTTIWNGIDVARFGYLGPRDGGLAVMVGRLSAEKDVATLIHAASIVVREYPAFRLEIAGDGPCSSELECLVARIGLGDHVRLLGEVRDVPNLLGRASLFVLPSLTEGISLTLLEAMARGLPVVATRVGGNPEVVDEGRTGLLVPERSPAELAGAILRLLRDPEMGRRMGLEGRHRVEQYFDVRRMVAQYERLYLEPRPHASGGGVADEPGGGWSAVNRPESNASG